MVPGKRVSGLVQEEMGPVGSKHTATWLLVRVALGPNFPYLLALQYGVISAVPRAPEHGISFREHQFCSDLMRTMIR